ncbi:GH1 family beta-glucosidase [Nocardiopsis coralliicola]
MSSTHPARNGAAPALFPEDFLWGASTSAFQIEGATGADGRGPSIWDTFAAKPGAVRDGDTGEPAADHYRRWAEDVAVMRGMGLSAYRFSLSWPRIQPDGSGALNQAGLDFYDRLTDGLLAAGIEPWPTLYHWDLPQALEDAGGWPVRDTALRFAEFAGHAAELLGDRIANWTTLNEPWCSAFLGYAAGVHAPGRTEPAASLAALHHLMLGHGLAAEVLRGLPGQPRIGLVHNETQLLPYRATVDDLDAARRADGARNRVVTGPLLHGAYPPDLVEDLDRAGVSDFGFVADGDLGLIGAPIDLLGVNFYQPHRVAASAEGVDPELVEDGGDVSALVGCAPAVMVHRGLPQTGMGWEIDPAGLYAVLSRLAGEAPGVDLYVIENGAAYPDEVTGGAVHDAERTAYLDLHIRAVHQAVRTGIPVRGYFAWSLLDNFEWAWGYSQRFGLVHVDYATQRRTVKDSGHWYAGVVKAGGITGAG